MLRAALAGALVGRATAEPPPAAPEQRGKALARFLADPVRYGGYLVNTISENSGENKKLTSKDGRYQEDNAVLNRR